MTFISPLTSFAMNGTVLLACATGAASEAPSQSIVDPSAAAAELDSLIQQNVHSTLLAASSPKRLSALWPRAFAVNWHLTEQEWGALLVYGYRLLEKDGNDKRGEMLVLEKSMARVGGLIEGEKSKPARRLHSLQKAQRKVFFAELAEQSGITASVLRRRLTNLEWFGGHIKSMILTSPTSRKGKKAMKKIWEALAQVDGLHFFRHLKVEGDTRSALQGIAESKVLLPVLRTLDLSGVHLGNADLAHLACFTQLSYLNLRYTHISDAGLAYLAGLTQLSSLNLREAHITDVGLKHLAGLTQLSYLNLWKTQVSDTGLKHLAGLTQLSYLNLGHTQVSDAGLTYLTGLTQLSYLNLWKTQVTDTGLKHLAGLTQLSSLNLWRTQVTDTGLKHLAGLTQLSSLNLTGIWFTDDGLAHLLGLAQLSSLVLRDTQVSQRGINEFRRQHPRGEKIDILLGND